MAINKNHECEELAGVKCAIVEKNAPKGRVDFLQPLLEFNKYKVIVVAAVPPPVSPPPPATPVENPPPPPELYTIGVTDLMFNPVNAIFGRLLRTPGGRTVTLAYWQQKDAVSHDEIPYFEGTK